MLLLLALRLTEPTGPTTPRLHQKEPPYLRADGLRAGKVEVRVKTFYIVLGIFLCTETYDTTPRGLHQLHCGLVQLPGLGQPGHA